MLSDDNSGSDGTMKSRNILLDNNKLNRNVEQISFLSANQELTHRFASVLKPPRFIWKDLGLAFASAEINEQLLRTIDEKHMTIVVDSAGDSESFQKLYSLQSAELWKLLDDGRTLLPRSLQLLRALHKIRKDCDLDYLLIFLIAGQIPTTFSHALLRIGADWLWSPGEDPVKLGEIINSLRALETECNDIKPSRKEPTRPRVFIVENSRNVCLALRIRLERSFDLHFVGENLPGNRFNVSVDAALQEFTNRGHSSGFIGAVVDLALTDISEELAKQRFASDDAAHRTFTNRDWRSIGEIFGGASLIKNLRHLAPNLPIFVFSNYIHSRNVDYALNSLLGRKVWQDCVPIPKNEKGYRSLKEQLLRLQASHNKGDNSEQLGLKAENAI